MEIISANYLTSSPSLQLCPPPDRPEYAFIGRSNVGKSSVINMLANNDKLAKTSGTPGKTQLINHFTFQSRDEENGKLQSWYLVDLPGYGFAKRSLSTRRQWEQMIDSYIQQRENLLQLFLLIDSRHTPQKIDIEFAVKLYNLHIPYTIIFTKTDKENQRVVNKNVKLFSAALLEFQQFLPRQLLSSSIKKTGRNKILSLITEMNHEFS